MGVDNEEPAVWHSRVPTETRHSTGALPAHGEGELGSRQACRRVADVPQLPTGLAAAGLAAVAVASPDWRLWEKPGPALPLPVHVTFYSSSYSSHLEKPCSQS